MLSAARDAENGSSTAMPAGESEVDDYSTLFRMTTHEPTTTRQRLKQSAMAAVVVGLLRDSGYLDDYNEENLWEIVCAVHKLVRVQDVNTHPIMAMDGDTLVTESSIWRRDASAGVLWIREGSISVPWFPNRPRLRILSPPKT